MTTEGKRKLLLECILSEQVPARRINELFKKDPELKKLYLKKTKQ